MENINCEIIRDLIPSYVDGVCSEPTKTLVESHIGGCGECRKMVELCRDRELSGAKLEQRELDGLKKVKNVMKFKSAVSYLLLAFMIYTGIQIFLANKVNYTIFSQPVVLLVICIFANLLSGTGRRWESGPGKREYLLGGISFLLSLYFALLFFYFVQLLQPDTEKIFGMELYQTGPFLERQLIGGFIAQIAFFAYYLWCILRQGKNCHWLLCLDLTGMFLIVDYDIWMKCMDSYDTLKAALARSTLETALIGLLGTAAVYWFTNKFQKKH